MSGILDYQVLSNTHSRESLLNYAQQNGIQWDEDNHEGVNWLRASSAIVRHLENKKEFITDNLTPALIEELHQKYTELSEIHRRTMIPHLRSAMQKLKEEGDGASQDMDMLEEAHIHLAANGGAVWADKLFMLRAINSQLEYLEKRAKDVPIEDGSE